MDNSDYDVELVTAPSDRVRKVVDYCVLMGWEDDFARYVVDEINNGWQPLGGVATVVNTDTTAEVGDDPDDTCLTYFAQAMVKYEQ